MYTILDLQKINPFFNQFSPNFIFQAINHVLNVFLDVNTKTIIQKHYNPDQDSVKNNQQEKNIVATTTNNDKITSQFQIIGIKLFLIYKKVIKKGKQIKQYNIQLKNIMLEQVRPSFQSTAQSLRKYVIIKEGIAIINVFFIKSQNMVDRIKQKFNQKFQMVKYSKHSKKITIVSSKVKTHSEQIINIFYHTLKQILKFKYSRKLYNMVINKYKTLRNQWIFIKQQSQIFSQKLISQSCIDPDQIDPQFKNYIQNKKFPRSMRSQDNLYNLRKISIAQQDYEEDGIQQDNKHNNYDIKNEIVVINETSSNLEVSQIIKIDESINELIEG